MSLWQKVKQSIDHSINRRAFTYFRRRLKAPRTTRNRKLREPRSDSAREVATRWQNVSNTSHTCFHCTCEFPLYPMSPMAAAAPFAEKRSPTMITSSMSRVSTVPLLLLLPAANESKVEAAAYEHAMAFDTTKYLNKSLWESLLVDYTFMNKHYM